MSPSTKVHRDLRLNVPRHNSQRIGPVLTKSVQRVALEQGTRVDVSQTALDPNSALAQAIESASDWNSLLMTARADRGPQWDVGTQSFHVDEYSNLYYDPGPLQPPESQQNDPEEPSSSSRQQEFTNSPRLTRTNAMIPVAMTPSMAQAQLYAAPQSMAFPGPTGGMSYGIPPAQFYGDSISASPMQPPPGTAMGIPMGMGMGMGIPDSPMSPQVRRRITRGMNMDEFGNMHG